MTDLDSAPASGLTGVEPAFRLPPRASFVVGLKRSGTSLLKSLLDGHPELWVLPRESKTFHWRESKDPVAALLARTRYGECFLPDSAEGQRFEDVLSRRLTAEAVADVPGAILALAESVAEVRGCPAQATYWMEKTPDHLLDVPALVRRFGPETRIVCTLRDPRAQIASRARRRTPEEHFSIPRFAYKWALGESLIQQFEASFPQFLLVRYEDIVLKTQETIERVLKHLELDWTDGLLVPTRDGSGWDANSSYGKRAGGITQDSLERYRQQLQPEQIAEIERLLGPRMARRGYELSGGAASGGRARRWLLDRRAERNALRQFKRGG